MFPQPQNRIPLSECKDLFDYFGKFDHLWKLFSLGGVACSVYKYVVDDVDFYVYDSKFAKITTNMNDYNCGFCKTNGFTAKFGKTLDDDPDWCPLGPEIMDLEISVNGCPRVGGKNCRFCYKNNTDAAPTNMSFDTFRSIIDTFPASLNQIAFGITGTKTNPDFPKMLEYCKEVGIVPNYTMSGADLDDEIIDVTKRTCGAVAISCYEGNKELCYNTIAKLHDKAPNVHVNMHIVLSKGTIDHVMDVLKDLSKTEKRVVVDYKTKTATIIRTCEDERLRHLRNVVFLRIKPVGRASNMDTTIDLNMFEKVINYCNENCINYGFDSCTAPDVVRVLDKQGKSELSKYCESCESGRFSAYINVKSEYWHCSFAENDSRIKPINVLDYKNATEWWAGNNMKQFRKDMNLRNEMHCPLFKLTSD